MPLFKSTGDAAELVEKEGSLSFETAGHQDVESQPAGTRHADSVHQWDRFQVQKLINEQCSGSSRCCKRIRPVYRDLRCSADQTKNLSGRDARLRAGSLYEAVTAFENPHDRMAYFLLTCRT